jgi:hypothetical protein
MRAMTACLVSHLLITTPFLKLTYARGLQLSRGFFKIFEKIFEFFALSRNAPLTPLLKETYYA